MWLCPKCSESVDDNFDVCWNCQTAKPGGATTEQSASATRDEPANEIIVTAGGDIIPVSDEVPAANPLAPNLGYGLALLCGFGLGFVIALFNFVGGHERRGFQAIVIQWCVVIWILAMLMFLMDLIGITGKPTLILLLVTTLLLPLAALWLLRRLPRPAPPAPVSAAPQISIKRRGGCLTAFLMFALTSNPFIALLYLLVTPIIQREFREIAWVVPVSIIGAIVSFFVALAVWNWKKVGVFGYAASYVVGIIISLAAGSIYAALLQLLGLAILISLVRPVWKHFE